VGGERGDKLWRPGGLDYTRKVAAPRGFLCGAAVALKGGGGFQSAVEGVVGGRLKPGGGVSY